ncbi:hypothetical protein FN846DRAFT_757959, partial [Sphaerosporella brunnea]
TIVPLIFYPDATHPTNFSGDGKAWPLYLTIRNLPAAIRNKDTMQAVILVGLLP